MKTFKYIITGIMLLFMAFSYTACDKIPEDEYLVSNPVTVGGQYVILEDYTGQKCSNCPDAAIKAADLKALYPNLIVVAVHATAFAKPDKSGPFTADYRTPEGTIWEKTFGITSAPKGMVNRISKTVYSPDDWGSAISTEIAKTPSVTLELKDMVYNEANRTLSAKVKASFLTRVDYDINLNALLLEDSIIGPQQNEGTPAIIDNYVFMHMLRKVEYGAWGKTFASASENIQPQDTIVMPIQIQLDSQWKAKNCHVVVYLSKNQQTTGSYDIIQATEQPVIGNHKK